MRRIGRVELAPNPLPHMESHAQWCRWLASRGSLDQGHRKCCEAQRCVATRTTYKPVTRDWRTPDQSWRQA